MKLNSFKFKEQRKYIHGPDIYYALVDFIQQNYQNNLESIKLVSRHLSQNQLFISEKLLESKQVQSTVDFDVNGEKKKLYLYEDNEPVTDVIEYDELEIVNKSKIDGERGRISGYIRYSVAEISVAILKEICKALISEKVKWVFVGLELKTSTEKHTEKEIEIRLIKNLGTKMILSNIYVDSELVGQLKFSSI